MNDIYSFYQLISKLQIEIPVIQRDYAQGRHNPKAEDVRKSMVRSMVKSVTEDGSPLFFDFVYGRTDGNKFIPFDGQQRLTTLFLFHKYVFEKCQSCSDCYYKSNCICKDVLLRFSYTTRKSSREFCERLVNENVIPDNTRSLSENVRNMSWFYSDWEKDPTIMGMLTMLDEIHNQLHSKNINNYRPLSEKLTSGCSCPITFHFVDMGEYKLSDETYVKMNARGKTLTPFENFKASLEQHLESKKEDAILSRLKKNADGKWLDLFWNVVNKGKEKKGLPDDAMMSFFNRHFMNVWRCWYGTQEKHGPVSETKKALEVFNDRIIKELPLHPKKDDFVSWDIYQNVLDNCGINECLTPIFNIWDELSIGNNISEDCQAVWNRGTGKNKWDLYVGENKNDREIYPSRVAFYALLSYFGVEGHKTSLAQWMRIVWNIIENSTIDSSDTYQAALRLMNKLTGKSYDIHDALANHFADFQLGSQYHAQDQVQEEMVKARMILDENGALREYNGWCKKADEEFPDYKTWENIIIAAESSAFFKGSIRFLFTNENGDLNDQSWQDFDTKWTNAQQFFNNGIVVPIIRIAEYFNDKQLRDIFSRYSFKTENWKSILLQKSISKPIHQFLLGKTVNNTSVLNTDIKNILESINTQDVWLLQDWQHCEIVLTNYSTRRSEPYKGYVFQVGNEVRNKWNNVISKISEIEVRVPPAWGDEKIEINGQVYYRGLWTEMMYKDHLFRYFGNNTVCLMTEDGAYIILKNDKEMYKPENTYYFEVTEDFFNKNKNIFEHLEHLITQADTDKQTL